MKKIFNFMCVVLIITGCSKDNDTNNNNNNAKLILRMNYDCSESTKFESVKSANAKVDDDIEKYTRFGDYITSITPDIFIGKFLCMTLQNWDQDGINSNYSIELIDGNSDIASSERLADFSNNASVDLNIDMKGLTKGEFNIFFFVPMFFYQELELPAEYDTVIVLNNINYLSSEIDLNGDAVGGIRNGRYLKGNNGTFMYPLFNDQMPHCYVFGSSDSSYVYFADGTLNILNPNANIGYTIRSSIFNNIVIEEPENSDTTIINGTLKYNTNNLIQIYAGEDNVPYTKDDYFVYAPNFWERLSVSMIKKEE